MKSSVKIPIQTQISGDLDTKPKNRHQRPQPMDVDALTSGGKGGKPGGKGKGKGGKPRGPYNPCGHCGRTNHMTKDCWSRGSPTKPGDSTKPQKGNAKGKGKDKDSEIRMCSTMPPHCERTCARQTMFELRPLKRSSFACTHMHSYEIAWFAYA